MKDKHILTYCLFTCFMAMHFFGSVMIPFFTEWGGISFFQIQLLQSWFMFWIFILELPTGLIADRIGRKHSLALGGLVVAIAVIVYSVIPSMLMFLVAEFLFAAAVALVSGADEAWLYDYLKANGKEDQSQLMFGRSKSFHYAGMLIASPVGAVVAARFGLVYPHRVSFVFFLMAGLLAWRLPEPKKNNNRSESFRFIEGLKSGFNIVLNKTSLLRLALISTIVNSCAYFVIWLYQPMLEQLGVPIQYYGFFQVWLLVVEIVVMNNFSRLSSLVPNYEVSIAYLTGLSFLLLALVPQLITLLVFLTIAGGFGLTHRTFLASKMQVDIPSSKRAVVMSSISMISRLVLTIFNPLIGLLSDINLTYSLLVVSIFSLLIFPVNAFFKTRLAVESV